ncbi:MAG: WG repeat-containing protein [Bacillota bacterium]|jgi:hypothetical protein
MLVSIMLFLFVGCSEQKLIPYEDENGLSGYKDPNGRVVIAPKYIFAEEFSKYVIAPVCDEIRGWIYIDCHDNFVIKPYYIKNNNDYDRFSEGLARYEEDGKIGFFNEKGAIVIEAKYEFASPFKNGLAAVGKNVEFVNNRTG